MIFYFDWGFMKSVIVFSFLFFIIGFLFAFIIFYNKNVGTLYICKECDEKPNLLLELFQDIEVLRKKKRVSFKVISR